MPSSNSGRLRQYLARIRRAAADTESSVRESAGPVGQADFPSDQDSVESLVARHQLSPQQADTVQRALEKIDAGQELDGTEMFAAEAIIIPDKRPAIDIINGDFVADHPLWRDFSTDTTLHRSICKAIPSVGRIELPNHPSLPYGGTGFVVGKDLLMTNRHVAELFTSGLGQRQLAFKDGLTAGIDFVREISSETSTVLDVRKVVMIHPYWDMALLQVEGLGPEHVPFTLSVVDPEATVGARIAVIGYPAFDPRNDAGVQNRVFRGIYNVKRLQPGLILPRASIRSFGQMVSALCHDSSTMGGNSGSAAYDPKESKVVALHFAGVYLDRNYCVPTAELARDGRIVDAGVNFEKGAPGGSPPWLSAWSKDDEAAVPTPSPTPTSAPPAPPTGSITLGEVVTWTFPIEISIRVGTPSGVPSPKPVEAAVEAMVAPAHDTNYATRKGYDEAFLGIPAPAPEPALADTVVTFGAGSLIPYHHFSVALHKARRIALFTASNVNGGEAAKKPEPGRKYDRKTLGGLGANDMEKWFSDPRVDPAYQLPDRFFTNDRGAFDKGHIVRREDVAWGASFAEVQHANGDTFHVTNCSPQVSGFNQSAQGVDNWGDLENNVMKQAAAEKLCVFAGPVLAKDDPIFVGVDDIGPVRIQIPQQYWKVIVARAGDRLQSFGFVLRQDLSDMPIEFAVNATWQKYMVSIATLEALNPLIRFHDSVRAADQAENTKGEAVRDELGVSMTDGLGA